MLLNTDNFFIFFSEQQQGNHQSIALLVLTGGNPGTTGGFYLQQDSNAERIIWSLRHDVVKRLRTIPLLSHITL